MMQRHCACCGKSFKPRPQVPDQAYCSELDCQRARKRQWQQTKLRSDPDYRYNQRDAQRAWLDRNPDYWRTYREAHPHQGNRERQRVHGANKACVDPAKMDVCDLPSGVYRIRRIPSPTLMAPGSFLVEITPLTMS